VRCQYCNKGYHWKGDNGLDCVADIDTGAQVGKSIHSFIDEMAAADAKCMAAGGELDDFGDCQCKDGYKWDDARTKCLVDKAAQLAAWDCSRMPNSTPAWDVVTGAFCQCNKGYKLEGFTKCIVDKQAQVAMADCSGTPNSRPYWDEKANAVRCLYCLQGNHWKDNTGLDCVADNSGGENNHTPSAQGPESAKCVQSKESLRHSIAVYQKQIDCTEEGMRKYGAQIDRRGKTNYWMDCNGNTMYYDLDPRIGIQKTQKYILELQAELNVPCY
ncbi:MAG TPA: hypothetical protein VJW95_05275, partial [Dissulfurispiraceae bacterium]|nr:hypothetical protein [Dissulfurispiraceae bacterium]